MRQSFALRYLEPTVQRSTIWQTCTTLQIKNEMYKYANLGMVMHFVLADWEVMAFSNSSKPPLFLSFLTRLLTAFSLHFSSPSPRFQPSNRFTGDERGINEVIITTSSLQIDTRHTMLLLVKSHTLNSRWKKITKPKQKVSMPIRRVND